MISSCYANQQRQIIPSHFCVMLYNNSICIRRNLRKHLLSGLHNALLAIPDLVCSTHILQHVPQLSFLPSSFPSQHQPLPLTSSSFLLFSLDSSLLPTSRCPSTLPPSLPRSSHPFLSLEPTLLIRPSLLQS